jgi:hypothetical protein
MMLASVFVVAYRLHIAVSVRVGFRYLEGFISATIIDDNYFQVSSVALTQNPFNRLTYVFLFVECRKNHANARAIRNPLGIWFPFFLFKYERPRKHNGYRKHEKATFKNPETIKRSTYVATQTSRSLRWPNKRAKSARNENWRNYDDRSGQDNT